MAIIQSGVSADLLTVGSLFKAARVEMRPVDYGGAGAYVYGGKTGVLPAALAANSEIFQFRWTSGAVKAVVRKIYISASVSTTFFAAGVPVQIDLVKSTGWTVAGTGGTGIVPAALLRRSSSMANTALDSGDMRIATTAALGAGTKTLESLSMSLVCVGGPITASLNGTIIPAGTILWEAEVADGEHPIILTANEGLSIRSVAVPATGTWMASINIDWTEVSSY